MPFIGNQPTAVPLTGADIQDGTIGIADLSATGTKDSTTFLRGDNTFQAVSSDYVKLGTVNITSVSSISIDGYFSSTYKNYEFYIQDYRPVSAGYLRLRVNVSGSAQTGGAYKGSSHYSGLSSGGASFNSVNNGDGWNATSAPFSHDNTTTSIYNGTHKLTLYDPLNTSFYKKWNSQGLQFNEGNGWIWI